VEKNKFIQKIFITFMSLAMLFSVCVPPSNAISLRQIEHKRRIARIKIFHLKKLERQEKSKLVRNQQQLEDTQDNLEASQNRYSTLTGQLNGLSSQLAYSVADYNQSNINMRRRLRHVYKSQRRGMLEMLLSVKDLNSMLDAIYFEKIVLKKDYQRILMVKRKAEAIMALKSEIQQKKLALAQTISDINSQQRYIQGAIAQNHNMISKLQSSRSAYERSERELARQSEYIQSMIARMQRHNKSTFITTGAFMKPIGGGITSPFGWRVHPIFHSRIFHSGIDIAGPYGGAIHAANSGRVIYAGWQGGYGKVVIIDHGRVNGRPTTTLYGHMSSINVGTGQSVSRGQTIGREGSTGYSTGPHCHFEVRINGVPQNPLRFI
jgi:murein DD-endopeptidase MepM/ murein hydrolase activator NlpD